MKIFPAALGLTFASLMLLAEPSKLGPANAATEWAERTLAKMPLEKKVAQIVFIDIAGGYLSADDPRLKTWIRMIHDFGVGGAVSYGGTPRDVGVLLNRLQREAEIPLLFSSDLEGEPGQQVSGATQVASYCCSARELKGTARMRSDRRSPGDSSAGPGSEFPSPARKTFPGS